ncbi:4-hydroxy-tetrahydrodipicolinate reductase [Methylocella tundrae]|uniref:4-hydroxy-tetrahydrodipicolinate reductase n=1 Tax=Methylocella tundrae TaxID=227605 RepID=A0A4U8Z1U4_METTU|nr:4-hydroxy-tetrahydrodipicolinate reductase [Methylocella tundrae]WPP03255.1 4-hydroxy-tetrahydrodipicolinate reductase [Methylocella tundrae]VFU09264.1 4-hydroxy-tetrahydrodipicolinate reductase [Methylocella tundrae]
MGDMRLVVAGAAGRMGRVLIQIIHETPGATLVGALARPDSIAIGQDAGLLAGCGQMGVEITGDALRAIAGADGVLDFTSPESTVALATLAAQARIVHVVGTTGLQPDHLARLEAAARHAVIVQSGNMSLGVNLMAALVERAAQTLGPEFDIEILEMHHRLKVDAPSGTALLLGEAAAKGRGVDLANNSVRSRDGYTGTRPEGAIGFASLRGGGVVGEHRVIFAGPGERLELFHIAEDRSIFARGAVKAALWAQGRKSGLYSMRDVLSLRN